MALFTQPRQRQATIPLVKEVWAPRVVQGELAAPVGIHIPSIDGRRVLGNGVVSPDSQRVEGVRFLVLVLAGDDDERRVQPVSPIASGEYESGVCSNSRERESASSRTAGGHGLVADRYGARGSLLNVQL